MFRNSYLKPNIYGDLFKIKSHQKNLEITFYLIKLRLELFILQGIHSNFRSTLFYTQSKM